MLKKIMRNFSTKSQLEKFGNIITHKRSPFTSVYPKEFKTKPTHITEGFIHRHDEHTHRKFTALEWEKNGFLHNENGPAIYAHIHETPFELMAWYFSGKLHENRDEPALIAYYDDIPQTEKNPSPQVYFEYRKNGRLHRESRDENGRVRPAIIDSKNGEMIWCRHGKYHSFDGEPAVWWNNGTKMWYSNGELHRVGNPAIVWGNKTVEYWVCGERHRESGPAVIYFDGQEEFWKNGRKLKKE